MKAEFLNDLVVKAYKPYKWLLFKRLMYWTNVRGKSELIEVPENFITDLASIPRVVRGLIPQNGRHRRAAVIHDYLYRMAGAEGFDWTRLEADKCFLEAMEVDGVPRLRRRVMYAAVRFWGGIMWDRSVSKKP